MMAILDFQSTQTISIMYKTIQATIQPSLYSFCSRSYNCFSFFFQIYLAMVTILDFQLIQTLPNMHKSIQGTIQPRLYSICLRFYNCFLKKKYIQLTLIVSNSVDSNFRLSRIFIEVPNFVVYKYI